MSVRDIDSAYIVPQLAPQRKLQFVGAGDIAAIHASPVNRGVRHA